MQDESAAEPQTEAPPEAPPEAPAQPESDKARRQRGGLELEVKSVTDSFATGNFKLPEGQLLTPHRIATAIASTQGVEKPSVGAVAGVVRRWSEVGYATVNDKPFAFLDYTEDARTIGLSALKQRAAEAKASAKAAAKAAEQPDAA